MAVFATCLTVCLTAWTMPAAAEDAGSRVQLGAASVRVPLTWQVGVQDEVEIAGMGARVVVVTAPDSRVTAYILVIDPFGVDIVSWSLRDLLAPTLVELLAYSGAAPKTMRIRKTPCDMGGEEQEGRLIIRPFDKQDQPRLVAGMACGIAEPSRWAAAFVVIEAAYDRPLLLRHELKAANDLVSSFRFD
jgi:hypothetical protein